MPVTSLRPRHAYGPCSLASASTSTQFRPSHSVFFVVFTGALFSPRLGLLVYRLSAVKCADYEISVQLARRNSIERSAAWSTSAKLRLKRFAVISQIVRHLLTQNYWRIQWAGAPWPPNLRRIFCSAKMQILLQIGQLSLAIPPWVGAMSTSQRAMIPCGLAVKAGMVREWVADKTVRSPAIAGHIRASLAVGSSHNRALFKCLITHTTLFHQDCSTEKYITCCAVASALC